MDYYKEGYRFLTRRQVDLLSRFEIVSFSPDPFRRSEVFIQLRGNAGAFFSGSIEVIVMRRMEGIPANSDLSGMMLVYANDNLSKYFELHQAGFDK